MGKHTSDFAAFIKDPPVIEISSGIATVKYCREVERNMSVRTLARIVERCQRALRRHAAGEENIIVDD